MNLVRIAMQSISVNWVRSLLSVLALSASVIGVVTVASASATIEATVTQRALMQGGPSATLLASGLTGSTGLRESDAWVTQLRGLSGDVNVLRIAQLDSTALLVDGKAAPLKVWFTEPGLLRVHPFQLVQGVWLSAKSDTVSIPIVVNQVEASAASLRVGSSVALRTPGVTTNAPGVVVGIVDDGFFDARAYATLSDSLKFLVENQGQLSTSIEVSSTSLTTAALSQRLNELSSLRGVHVDWSVQKIDTVGRLRLEVEATRSAFLLVGILGLLAGALAMANIGLSALRERSSELSLRRALGARRWHLPAVMVLESQLIAIVAGGIAIGMSAVLYPVLAQQIGAPYGIATPTYPIQVALLGILIGMATAFVGSLVPALHSLRMPIANIMRA